MSLEKATEVSGKSDDFMKPLLNALCDAVLSYQVPDSEDSDQQANLLTFDGSVSRSIDKAVAEVDRQISMQLREVLRAKELQDLEGTWRGVNYLVRNTETGTRLKIKLIDASKKDVSDDLANVLEFDQSQLFKKVYEAEYGSPGGEPYGVLLADYYIDNSPPDMTFLRNISGVAAASFTPFIAAADPTLCGLETWTDLAVPRDLAKLFDSVEFASWRGYRSTEDSRYVTLTMPRTLARLPYGNNTAPVEEFHFEEVDLNSEEKFAKPVDHAHYTWMNTSFVLGARLTEAFAQFGWCTAIRGAEGGGRVEGLPAHIFQSDDGDLDMKCPTEIGITDRREAELAAMGFCPLSHYKNQDYAVFFGGETTQRAKVYDVPAASENAAISARLPCIMASSRIAHYLKVIARDKIGSFMELADCSDFLNRWVNGYVAANVAPTQAVKASYPLAEAVVRVEAIPGRPGAYQAVAWLRPWLQLEELNTSIRLVATIPA